MVFSVLSFSAISSRSSGMPAVLEYRVWPALMAAIVSFTISLGVWNEGSPRPRDIIDLPCFFNSLAASLNLSVADSCMSVRFIVDPFLFFKTILLTILILWQHHRWVTVKIAILPYSLRSSPPMLPHENDVDDFTHYTRYSSISILRFLSSRGEVNGTCRRF